MFSINIKNGAKMKKFKKGEKSKNKVKEDISSMYYWCDKNCILMSASWDGHIRLFDDSDSSEEGLRKQTTWQHKDSANYIDFKLNGLLCASCGDDGIIIVYNFNSYRQEGMLKYTNPNFTTPSPVKFCKFLEDTDILVSADLDGFISFWCVSHELHPKKNQLLCQV